MHKLWFFSIKMVIFMREKQQNSELWLCASGIHLSEMAMWKWVETSSSVNTQGYSCSSNFQKILFCFEKSYRYAFCIPLNYCFSGFEGN